MATNRWGSKKVVAVKTGDERYQSQKLIEAKLLEIGCQQHIGITCLNRFQFQFYWLPISDTKTLNRTKRTCILVLLYARLGMCLPIDMPDFYYFVHSGGADGVCNVCCGARRRWSECVCTLICSRMLKLTKNVKMSECETELDLVCRKANYHQSPLPPTSCSIRSMAARQQ